MYALRERRVHVTQEDFEMAVAKVCVTIHLYVIVISDHCPCISLLTLFKNEAQVHLVLSMNDTNPSPHFYSLFLRILNVSIGTCLLRLFPVLFTR